MVVRIDDMTPRALVLAAVVLVVAAIPTAAAESTSVTRLALAQDASLPFWCDWGYDWDERCYQDDGDRLPIGGDEDKVWRAALKFELSALPPGATVVRASLYVFHDGRCLGPRKTMRVCEPRDYEIEAHPILSASWTRERELDFSPDVAGIVLRSAAQEQWLAFDLTDLVADWVNGARPNTGVLLKLSDTDESYDVSGPKAPSSSFADLARRPRLEVAYVLPAG
jgi:hypothetical protein